MAIRWEAPPPAHPRSERPRGPKSALSPLADELRARPGEWAIVFEGAQQQGKASGMAAHIRLGQVQAFTPTGDFDAVTRTVDGLARVYARYIGEAL